MSAAPPKPWERGLDGGATSNSAASSLPPKPWERAVGSNLASDLQTSTSNAVALSSANPARPWEQTGDIGGQSSSWTSTSYANNQLGSYNGSYGWNRMAPYGSNTYGSGFNSYSSPYSNYNSYGYGSSYGSQYGSGWGSYGGSGGIYGHRPGLWNQSAGPYGYGGGPMGAMGTPNAPFDPNNPPRPPTGWQAFLQAVNGVMTFFGRLSFLVDENAHAVHMFISALLQLLDRVGSLYGELARFILRLLGYKRLGSKQRSVGSMGAIVPAGQDGGVAAGAGKTAALEKVWSNGS